MSFRLKPVLRTGVLKAALRTILHFFAFGWEIKWAMEIAVDERDLP